MLDLFNSSSIHYNLSGGRGGKKSVNYAYIHDSHFQFPESAIEFAPRFDWGAFGHKNSVVRVSNNKIKVIPPVSFLNNPFDTLLRKRGVITEFSEHSKSRFESKLDNYKVIWRSFITLTFRAPHMSDSDFRKVFDIRFINENVGGFESFGQSMRLAYNLLKRFVQDLCRQPFIDYMRKPLFFWKKEFTSRGVVHFHLLSNFDFKPYVKVLERIWGRLTFNKSRNSCDVSKVRKQRSITWYIAKYISKHDKDTNLFCCKAPSNLTFGFVGRWWGSFNEKYWANRFFPPREYELDDCQFFALYHYLCYKRGIKEEKTFYRTLTFQNTDYLRYVCLLARSIGWYGNTEEVLESRDVAENLPILLGYFERVKGAETSAPLGLS